MNTTFSTTGLARTTESTRRVFSFFRRYWGAFQEWRKRERLRANLYGLNDRELQDIGIARGEVDYVVSNRRNSRKVPGPLSRKAADLPQFCFASRPKDVSMYPWMNIRL